MARDSIPTSRVRRTAKIGGLAAGQAIRQAATSAANVARDEEGKKAALERRHIEAAEQIAGTAPVASRLTTRALRAGHADVEAALQWEALAQPVTLATADLQEGLNAARGRREPRFTGR